MSRAGLTRRAVALAGLGASIPAFCPAYARGRVVVDVSPLRRDGDNTDADYFARVLPGYIEAAVGPGRRVSVRVDSVSYGTPGSAGGNITRAVDRIEGVGALDGRTFPVLSTIIAEVILPDPAGYAAHERQDTLARAFAQWLPRQAGW